mmetsp:Transcript_36275/g.79201  ORF Transcript_36275/g.79201 Transcript_36275/m.79201 type:complete len:227 (+) Transcript_36275:316-996(+)
MPSSLIHTKDSSSYSRNSSFAPPTVAVKITCASTPEGSCNGPSCPSPSIRAAASIAARCRASSLDFFNLSIKSKSRSKTSCCTIGVLVSLTCTRSSHAGSCSATMESASKILSCCSTGKFTNRPSSTSMSPTQFSNANSAGLSSNSSGATGGTLISSPGVSEPPFRKKDIQSNAELAVGKFSWVNNGKEAWMEVRPKISFSSQVSLMTTSVKASRNGGCSAAARAV